MNIFMLCMGVVVYCIIARFTWIGFVYDEPDCQLIGEQKQLSVPFLILAFLWPYTLIVLLLIYLTRELKVLYIYLAQRTPKGPIRYLDKISAKFWSKVGL